jgi:methylated-DNA-protein-cysteine methyltransferase-like protein
VSSADGERILAVVSSIPRGKVATYGQVAALAGLPRRARLVGRTMATLEDDRVPWHRVVNARGEISRRGEPYGEELQRVRLRREGVKLQESGRIDLSRFGWQPEVH